MSSILAHTQRFKHRVIVQRLNKSNTTWRIHWEDFSEDREANFKQQLEIYPAEQNV